MVFTYANTSLVAGVRGLVLLVPLGREPRPALFDAVEDLEAVEGLELGDDFFVVEDLLVEVEGFFLDVDGFLAVVDGFLAVVDGFFAVVDGFFGFLAVVDFLVVDFVVDGFFVGVFLVCVCPMQGMAQINAMLRSLVIVFIIFWTVGFPNSIPNLSALEALKLFLRWRFEGLGHTRSLSDLADSAVNSSLWPIRSGPIVQTPWSQTEKLSLESLSPTDSKKRSHASMARRISHHRIFCVMLHCGNSPKSGRHIVVRVQGSEAPG